MDLRAELESWDCKTTSGLREIADSVLPRDYDDILRLVRGSDETSARAASWVMKILIEEGARIEPPWEVLTSEPHWEVALHILQSVQHRPANFPPEILTPYLKHDRPMLRAWSLDALVRLGGQDAQMWLERGLRDQKAAVRARARNLSRLI